MKSTSIFQPLLPISCIRLNISDIDGTSSIKQNNTKTISIIMLKTLIAGEKQSKLIKSNPISKSIMIAFGKTPSQNSFRDDLPLKSNALTKNNLKAINIVIFKALTLQKKLCRNDLNSKNIINKIFSNLHVQQYRLRYLPSFLL